MPAASCRTRPARSIRRWLTASASAGSSRSVGTRERRRRIRLAGDAPASVSVRRLVRALDSRVVDEPLDRLAAQDVRLEDFLEIGSLHARVPDVLGIDDHHRAVPALREAAGLVDAGLRLLPGFDGFASQVLDELLHVTLRRAG